MKKLFAVLPILAFALATAQAFAQPAVERRIINTLDTNVNLDTVFITYPAMGSNLKSITATVTRISGTIAGGVYLQGTVNGVDWENIGSNDTLIATGTRAYKKWIINSTDFYSYRLLYRSFGTQRSVLSSSYLRRSDEK